MTRGYGASAYAARAAAARPLARGHSGCFAWNSFCTVVAVSSAERPWRLQLARARLHAPHDRAVRGNDRTGRPRRRAKGRWSSGSSLRTHRTRPATRSCSTPRSRRGTSCSSRRRPRTRRRPLPRRTPVSPRVCVGPTTTKTHADAAQIQHVVAVERDVGLAAGGVLQQFGRHRRPAARMPGSAAAPPWANSASCTVEFTYFAVAGNAR